MTYNRIIIVGNSPNVLEHKNGHLIDEYDTVIRLGSIVDKCHDCVGTKTDILCTRWARGPHANIRTIWFPYLPKMFEPENANIAGAKTVYMETETYANICERLKVGQTEIIPTLGLGSIYMAMDIFPNCTIDITGFTLDIFDEYFSKGEYWDTDCKRENARHNLVGESLDIKGLLRNNRIRYKYF